MGETPMSRVSGLSIKKRQFLRKGETFGETEVSNSVRGSSVLVRRELHNCFVPQKV